MVNRRGGAMFTGKMSKRRGAGIFLASDGALTKVAGEGDPTPVGGVFGVLSGASLNDTGAVAFRASVVGGRGSQGVFLGEMDHVKFGAGLFRAHCGICHPIDVVTSMEFNRAGWNGLVDDMVTEFGAVWIGPKDRKIFVDYLVENYGEK